MRRKIIIPVVMILVSLFVSSPVMAKIPVPFPKIDVDVVMADHYPVRDISFPDGVRGIPSLIYWQPTGYRPLTLDRYLFQALEWQLLGCFDKQCARQQMTSASPVADVDRNEPPMLLIAGEEDKTVPFY